MIHFWDSFRSYIDQVRSSVTDDEKRLSLLFSGLNGLFCFVALFMSIVNIFTAKWLLFSSTLTFFLACFLNLWLFRKGQKMQQLSRSLFLIESLLLCSFFCISGTPEGFSALWICFIPSFSFTLLGIKRGAVYSGLGFLLITLLFWTPFGRGLLQYDYTASFMLRFPMIYVAFVATSLFLEAIRAETQRQLKQAEAHYHHLYKHDPLTGLYNRYGFNKQMDSKLAEDSKASLTMMILDIDHFKDVNDTYGHDRGDYVLRYVADTIQSIAGQQSAVSRWGGEEFTVLMDGIDNAPALAEAIRSRIDSSIIEVDGMQIRITVSIGVCMVRETGKVSPAQIVKNADKCLYEAKGAGRNQVASIQI